MTVRNFYQPLLQLEPVYTSLNFLSTSFFNTRSHHSLRFKPSSAGQLLYSDWYSQFWEQSL